MTETPEKINDNVKIYQDSNSLFSFFICFELK